MPRPNPPIPTPPAPQPNTPQPEQPKPDKPEPEPVEPAPEEILWQATADAGLAKKELGKAPLWDVFTGMSELESTKPVMIYFYCPEQDSDDDDVKNMIRRCHLIAENVFADEAVRRASLKFHCRNCDFNEISDEVKKKYKLVVVPKVLFFDVCGRKVWQLTSTGAAPDGVAKKMDKIAAASAKLLEKMKK